LTWLTITSIVSPPPQECPLTSGAVAVQAVASASEVERNNTFQVSFFGDFDHEVVSLGFHVDYDPSLITLNSLTVAPAFKPLKTSAPNAVAALAYPTTAFGSDVLLATATFTAIQSGTAQIGVSVTPGNVKEGFFYRECGSASLISTPTTVTIPPERPIPEPSTYLLLILGSGLVIRPRWLKRPRIAD